MSGRSGETVPGRRGVGGVGRGAVLVLTLVATVALGVISLGLARYVGSTLRSQEYAARRAQSEAVATAGLHWYLEELAAKRITDDCETASTGAEPVVPRALGDVEVSCVVESSDRAGSTLVLTATGRVPGNVRRVVRIVVDVPPDEYTVHVHPEPRPGEGGRAPAVQA